MSRVVDEALVGVIAADRGSIINDLFERRTGLPSVGFVSRRFP